MSTSSSIPAAYSSKLHQNASSHASHRTPTPTPTQPKYHRQPSDMTVKLPASTTTPLECAAPQSMSKPTPAFSAVPSVNDVPDPGWAAWGADPSTIKKEEEQVKRPTATLVKVEDVISNLGRNRSSHSPISSSVNHLANGREHANASSSNISARQSYGSRQTGQARFTRSPLYSTASSSHPPQYPVRLPPPSFAQQPPPQISNSATRGGALTSSSPSMRPPPIQVTYAKRPTFQYNDHISTATTTSAPFPAQVGRTQQKDITTPAKSSDPYQKEVNNIAASPAQATSTTSSTNEPRPGRPKLPTALNAHAANFVPVHTGFPSKIPHPDNGLEREQTKQLDTNDVRRKGETIKGPRDLQDSSQEALLQRSPSADSGHASYEIDSFKLHLPESLSIPKSLRVIDYNELKLLGKESGIDIQIELSDKSIIFKMKNNDITCRKQCNFLIEMTLDALQNACPGEEVELRDLATRNLMAIMRGEESSTDMSVGDNSVSVQDEDSSTSALKTEDISSSQPSKSSSSPVSPPISPRKSLLTLLNEAQSETSQISLESNQHEQVQMKEFNNVVEAPANSIYETPSSDLTRLLDNAVTVPHGSLLLQASTPVPDHTFRCASSATVKAVDIHVPNSSSFATPSQSQGDCNADTKKEEQITNIAQDITLLESSNSHTIEDEAWIRQDPRRPGLYEICLPLPDHLVLKTGGRCKLESQIPIERTDWHRSASLYYLRDKNKENLAFARKVFLVVIYLIQPSFLPSDPILQLKEGTKEHHLVKELSQDKYLALRKSRIDILTGHVIARLRETECTRDLSHNCNGRSSNASPTNQWSESASIIRVDAAFSSAINSLEVSSCEKEETATICQATDSHVMPDKTPSQVGKPVEVAKQRIGDSRDIVTPLNSLCWYMPGGAGRKRFVGYGANIVRNIRQAAGITDIFWRSASRQDDGWFMFLVGSNREDMNEFEKERLAYALRLCKSWAIAVFAPDVLPLMEDLPTFYREDSLFRLDEMELSTACSMSETLRNIPNNQWHQRSIDAFCALVKVCKRPHMKASPSFRPLYLLPLWPGVFSEICTPNNSISWTVSGISKIIQFGGSNYSNLMLIKKLTGTAAVKLDNNDRRYGQDACRVYLLGSWRATLNSREVASLLAAFRLMIAAMRLYRFESLLPSEANTSQSELAQKALSLARQDEAKLYSITPSLAGVAISHDSLRAIYLHLQLDDVHESSQVESQKAAPQSVDHSSIPESAVGSVDDAESPFNRYLSFRDIPEFAISHTTVDDGYMNTSDELAYEDTPIIWQKLKYVEKMALIGSACWVVRHVESLISEHQSTMYESGSIGPSASQIGSDSTDSTVSRAHNDPGSLYHANSSWETSQDLANGSLGAIEEWAKHLPPRDSNGLHNDRGQPGPEPPIGNGHHTIANDVGAWKRVPMEKGANAVEVFLPIPSDHRLRSAILGQNSVLLRHVSIQTGADVRLCNNGRNPGDSAQAIGLCGQPKSVNRAIQMVQAAVLTHFPAWQFPLWVERLVQDFKRAETERLASVLSSTSNGRWSLNHITFVPEETIPSIKQAIHANVFVVSSCAIVKIDPVLVGKVTLDAPTSHQADAALIQLCDVVRNTVPGWAPESGTAREVILEADKQAGPGTTKAISTW